MVTYATLRNCTFAAACIVCGCAFAQGSQIDAGKFSAMPPGGELPPGWKALEFRNIEKHTAYSLVPDEGVTVVKAVAEASALLRARTDSSQWRPGQGDRYGAVDRG